MVYVIFVIAMNEKKEKNQLTEIFLIIVYALIATAVLASIILLINCFWPKQNLFKAETWGTISDWFTYLVTLIGGVFIYKTLESQMEVKRSQDIITKIENNKHLYSIKPNIKISAEFVNDVYNEDLDDRVLNIILNIKSDKPTSYNIWLSSKYLPSKFKRFDSIFKHIEPSTSSHHITIPQSVANSSYPLIIYLDYEDIEGNKYTYMMFLFILYIDNKYEFRKAIARDELK